MPTVTSAGLLLLASIFAQEARGGKHPSLVDPATTKCESCHAEVLKGKVQHPPALEDCGTCHAFSKKDGQTWVERAAVGNDLCLSCHGDLEKAAKGELEHPHAPVVDSCTTCHVPHSGDEPRLLASRETALCAGCHVAEDVNKSHPLPVSRAACSGCHSAHGSAAKGMLVGSVVHAPFGEKSCDACHRRGLGSRQRLLATGSTLCFACHSDVERSLGKGVVHGAVREGRCVGCHDPHVTVEKKLLKVKGPALCTPCHKDVEARVGMKTAHAPAKKECLTCHEPHRGDTPSLLVRPAAALCLSCHPVEKKDLAKKHLGADLAKSDCASCHEPHGAAGGHAIRDGSRHSPFAEGSCDSCHAGSASKLVAEGKELCVACHSDVPEAAAKAKVPHAAMEADCTVCHAPHASVRPKLVRAANGGACLACHDDQGPKADETMHGAVSWFGCEACHEPHGGGSPKLLRLSANELCLGCHAARVLEVPRGKTEVRLLDRYTVPVERAKAIRPVRLSADGQRDHPLSGHRTIGKPTPLEMGRLQVKSSFSGELGCLSCHDPHKGKSPKLFAKGVGGGERICQECHVK